MLMRFQLPLVIIPTVQKRLLCHEVGWGCVHVSQINLHSSGVFARLSSGATVEV